MKPFAAAAVLAASLAGLAIRPAHASTTAFVVDFEKSWDYANGDVDGYYAGGFAADGTAGPNRGVSFVNFSGLSNDPSFPFYAGAPSSLGVAYGHTFETTDRVLMNVAGGVGQALSFFYSTPSAVVGAVRAYSGLDGTGTLLGTFDLAANSADYGAFTLATFGFSGYAQSFDFTAAANLVDFDNIGAAAVPESETLLLVGVGAVAFALRRRRGA